MFSFNDLVKAWDKFFFEEKPTEGIAVFRIVWFSLIFTYFILDLNNINDFYGPHALISLNTVKSQFPNFHMNVFHMFRPRYEVTYSIMALYGIALFFSLIGFYTRGSLIVALVCMTSLHQRNIWLLSSSEVLMRTITLLLICSPCGHSLSVDSLLGRHFKNFRKKKTWPVWALRLIQIQVCVVYLWTSWHKLKGEDWINGTAVYYATRIESMTNFTIPYVMNSLPVLKLATWGTLIIELSLGILVWFKEYRRTVILFGIFFHISIEYLMSIPFFELYMIALILNFYTPEEHKAFVDKTIHSIINGIQESTLTQTAKEKLIGALRGSA